MSLWDLPSSATRGDMVMLFVLSLAFGVICGWFLADSRARVRRIRDLKRDIRRLEAAKEADFKAALQAHKKKREKWKDLN